MNEKRRGVLLQMGQLNPDVPLHKKMYVLDVCNRAWTNKLS